MQHKVIYFNHFSSVFCKLQCYENKNKKYKNNGDRSQAKGAASTLKTGKLHYQTVNMFSDVSCTHGRTCVYGRYAPVILEFFL